MVISGFLVVTAGRAKRKKENGTAKFLQAGVIFFFWTYLLGQDNRVQDKPEEFILPVFKKDVLRS